MCYNVHTCFSGNKHLLANSKEDVLKSSPNKRGTPKKSQEGMILYKGAMVDIASVMQRSEKSEKMRVQLEAKLKELQDDMGKSHCIPAYCILIEHVKIK